jgi:hypothetical protein
VVINGVIEPDLDAPMLRKMISDLFVKQKSERRT